MAIYSDVRDAVGLTPIVEDLESIYQSLRNIFATFLGERLFRPDFGASLGNFLFEVINDSNAFVIESYLFNAITKWEPRVRLLQQYTSVIPYPDEHRYEVSMGFRVIGLEDQVFRYSSFLEGVI